MPRSSRRISGGAPENPHNIQALKKGLMIVELASQTADSLSLPEISKHIEASPEVTVAILDTLVSRGYLNLAANGVDYEATSKLVNVVEDKADVRRLLAIARPRMEAMAMRLHISSHLSVVADHWLLTVGRADAPSLFNSGVWPGSRHDMTKCAAGQLLFGLGTLSQRETVEAALRRKMGEPEWAEFNDAADTARANGYCVAASDVDPRAMDMAAPLFDASGVRGSLTVSHFPAHRGASFSQTLDTLRRTCDEISRDLGFVPSSGSRSAPVKATRVCPPTLTLVK